MHFLVRNHRYYYMSRSDTPILCLIRYKAVARLQLTRFLCLDTTPRARCLKDCPTCVTVNVAMYALVTFHSKHVCTVQHVSPVFSSLGHGAMSGKSAIGRTLLPLIARPSSTLVSSASLRDDPGSHSLILGVHVTSTVMQHYSINGILLNADFP
jgi:hypothetical protein